MGRQREPAGFDHDPTRAEVLAALEALGPVEVLAEYPNDRPPAPTYPVGRDRVVNLASCSTADLHCAVDKLDRDTCNGGRCSGRVRCRRHTWKRRGRRP